MFRSRLLLLFVLSLMLGTSACSPEPAVPVLPQIAPAPSLEPTETATPEPTPTPSSSPTITPTPTTSPTPTQTPTPLPVVAVNGCAEIWKPGYYKVANDIRTPRLDCFVIQSHNVVLDCDNRTIFGRSQTGYGVVVRRFNFPLLETPTNVEIKNCRITQHRTGIVVLGGINIYIHNNELSKNYDDTDPRRYGTFLGMSEAGGVRFDGVQNARLESNQANDQAIGFDIRNSERITLRGNTANRNSAWGISLINTSYSEVASNTTRDNVRYCTWGDNKTVGRGCDAGGIFLQDGSSHNVIRDNIITGENGNGIFIKAHGFKCGDSNLIQGNKIVNALYNSIEFSFCKDNKVIGNEMSGSFDAVFFGFSQNTEVRNNIISNMRNHGIISWNSRNSIIDGNEITNSREGIYLYWDLWDTRQFAFLPTSPDRYASRDNVITNNILRENSRAAIRLSNSIRNRIENNQFFYNPRDLMLEGTLEGNLIPMLTPQPPPTPLPSVTPPASPTP